MGKLRLTEAKITVLVNIAHEEKTDKAYCLNVIRSLVDEIEKLKRERRYWKRKSRMHKDEIDRLEKQIVQIEKD